jgi:hypothetical protein
MFGFTLRPSQGSSNLLGRGLLLALLAGCGTSTSALPELSVVVRSDVGPVDSLRAAVFGPNGVITRQDGFPSMGPAVLPGRLTVDLGGRTGENLMLMIWGIKGGAVVGFADLSLPANGKGAPELTLVALGADADADAVPDRIDRCRFFADPDQTDSDADGTGDACGCRESRSPGTLNVSSNLVMWTTAANLERSNWSSVPLGMNKVLRFCRTDETAEQFGSTADWIPPAGTQEVELSVLISSATSPISAQPIIRQKSTGCDSSSNCNTGGLTGKTPISATPGWISTRMSLKSNAALEFEITSYTLGPGTCLDVHAICAVVTKP